jgi:High-temperature-induced dauer-formation protein
MPILFLISAPLLIAHIQKFCTFVLESEKSMDFIAYLLFYCVEIKDKPRRYFIMTPILLFSTFHRATRSLSRCLLHSSGSVSGACIWASIERPNQSATTDKVGPSRYSCRLYNSCAYLSLQLDLFNEHCTNQAVYAIVATTAGSLTLLYPSLIIALSNAAPYFKHIGVSASARLIQLLTSFSNPLFLLSDEGHPRLLFFMYVSSLSYVQS